MKIQINLELIPAPKENGTYVNDIYHNMCEGCFFEWIENGCTHLATPTQTVGCLCRQDGKDFIWKEIKNENN